MKKVLLTLAALVSLSGFAANITGPKPFVDGRVGFGFPTAVTASGSGGALWNAKINRQLDVDFGVKGKLGVYYGSYFGFGPSSFGVDIVPMFTWNLNIKTNNPKYVGYVGTDLGVGLNLTIKPQFVPHFTGAGNIFGGVKIDKKYKIGGFIGSDGIGVDAGYLF
ncbi:hypothetical protein [Oceanivirga salmonicida]|uniref:hypothetical protein n=1 Tax=Oceanivirga salmonicida TaxID=1769291 RepID=UPI0012E122DE|nr:hypothetical protein [Oceanivirga salmonicida]